MIIFMKKELLYAEGVMLRFFQQKPNSMLDAAGLLLMKISLMPLKEFLTQMDSALKFNVLIAVGI